MMDKTIESRFPNEPWTCSKGHANLYRIGYNGRKYCRMCYRAYQKKYASTHPTVQRSREYKTIHEWILTKLKKTECAHCGHDGSDYRLECSNISGEYRRDVSDWQVLCKPCHYAYDRSKK